MKHNIRQRVINQYGLPVVKIETVHGELGSDLLDCNGKEIFENDLLCYYISATETVTDVVKFNGNFVVGDHEISEFAACDIEIVGHAED